MTCRNNWCQVAELPTENSLNCLGKPQKKKNGCTLSLRFCWVKNVKDLQLIPENYLQRGGGKCSVVVFRVNFEIKHHCLNYSKPELQQPLNWMWHFRDETFAVCAASIELIKSLTNTLSSVDWEVGDVQRLNTTNPVCCWIPLEHRTSSLFQLLPCFTDDAFKNP